MPFWLVLLTEQKVLQCYAPNAVYHCLFAGQLCPSCGFSSANSYCRCFQVSNPCRAIHSTAFVSAICRSAYFQLRQLRPVARSLTVDAAKTIVHAFIACRLDYCNSLLHGITDSLFRRLQSVQNAADRTLLPA